MRRRGFLRVSGYFSAAAGAGLWRPVLAKLPSTKLVIGFPVGGSSDTVARLFSEVLRGPVSDVVTVEARTGGGGTIAADYLKNAAPDGSTLLISPSTVFTLQPHTNPKLRYDPATDFLPVAGLAIYGGAIVVGPKVPDSVRTLEQFAAWAKAHPAEASYGSPGAGGGSHFVAFQTFRALGVPMTHVPYRGNSPAVTDVIGGQIATIITGIPEILPHVRTGKARVLAITLPARSKLLPDAPTLAELGHTNITGGADVMGVYAPARTPAVLVDEVSALAQSTTTHPAFLQAYAGMAYEPHYLGPQDFAAHLQREREGWKEVVRSSDFKPES